MSDGLSGLGAPVQIAYGVDDVETAARLWVERHGVGPFFMRHHIPVTNVEVGVEFEVDVESGAESRSDTFDHSSAYGWWGSLMVELVTVHDPPELATVGLHHLAHFVDSVDDASAALSAQGRQRVLRATAGGTTFVYHDARAELGHLIEMYEPSDQLRGFYAMVAEAANGWDGRDPVRFLG